MSNFKLVDEAYYALWDKMVIRPEWKTRAETMARKLITGRPTYQAVCDKVNSKMPWYFVAVLDAMEGDGGRNKHLHNGNSLKRRTADVPAGRPIADPWNGKAAAYTFLESAIDALTMPGKSFHVQTVWNLDRMLYRIEAYNGFGYYKYAKILSPYLWSGTEYYSKGKYAADGKFDPNLVSEQVGAAVLLRYITDKSLGIAR